MTKSLHTLGQIKEGIYKALGEFSVNGEKLKSGGSKADKEQKILSAINSSLSRLYFSLPSETKTQALEFSRPDVIYSQIGIKGSDYPDSRFSLDIPEGNSKLYLAIWVCGSLNITATDKDGSTVFNRDVSTSLGRIDSQKAIIESEEADIDKVVFTGNFVLQSVTIYKAKGFYDLTEEEIPSYGTSTVRLPDGFGRAVSLFVDGRQLSKSEYDTTGSFLTVNGKIAGFGSLEYVMSPYFFTDSSGEDESVEMSEIAFFALIYLAASELCDAGDGELYARLVAKYQDIALNCREDGEEKVCRNSFYVSGRAR